MSEPIIVLGSGLSGLMAAVVLKQKFPRQDVINIEKAPQSGGLLIGHRVLGDRFDIGTHILQETGRDDIDTVLRACIKPENLIVLDSAVGDVSATVVGGGICDRFGYPDVLSEDEGLAKQILTEMEMLPKAEPSFSTKFKLRHTDFRVISRNWFGETATTSVTEPLVRRLFGEHNSLSGFALELCNATRLGLVDVNKWEVKAPDDTFRARVAYPDQRNLPIEYRHNRKSLYSFRGGSSDFVRGLMDLGFSLGIKYLTNTNVNSIDTARNELSISANGETTSISYAYLVSSIGPIFTRALISGVKPVESDRVVYRLIHIVLDRPTNSDVCYAYFHDFQSPFFRITNYGAFSGREHDERLTIEVLGHDDISDSRLLDLTTKFLLEFEWTKNCSVVKSQVVRGMGGFPIPTLSQFDQYYAASQDLESIKTRSVVFGGVGSEGVHFFQNEVLTHLLDQLSFIS